MTLEDVLRKLHRGFDRAEKINIKYSAGQMLHIVRDMVDF